MKQLSLILFLLTTGVSSAQTNAVPKEIQTTFAGIWEVKEKYGTNTVSIRFEPGKNYAVVKDIGNGMAPPRTFQATLKGKTFVIPAQKEKNDYIELEVIRGKLHLRSKPVNWNGQGDLGDDNANKFKVKIFTRMLLH
ncbi:hypothetical protein [Niabella drilacis]|uniref:Lipocalin-like domain-containing protein n=1 Tax=Niabella drilacis (strain DSM 25811 / CCM 8410 / CCUG 62505 / LMG 26954 / E90) TaxID=1285928 RepID=A0A1G6TFA0_NIADE|nr:hypothetical protein [Niabella drilacis]SDD27107.1 hypothetical protein SAMN04487894_107179 [Niabella drilacis]